MCPVRSVTYVPGPDRNCWRRPGEIRTPDLLVRTQFRSTVSGCLRVRSLLRLARAYRGFEINHLRPARHREQLGVRFADHHIRNFKILYAKSRVAAATARLMPNSGEYPILPLDQ